LNLYDMGSLLDASWRVFIGQVPYRDFIAHVPPVHLYLNAFFFSLFGFGKVAILAHLIFVSSVLTLAVYGLVLRRVPTVVAALIAALTMVSFYWSWSHPWYTATAHFWGLIGVLGVASAFGETSHAPAAGRKIIGPDAAALAAGLLSVFSFLSKPNVGFCYGALFLTVFCLSPRRAQVLGAYLLGGLAAFIAAWAIFFPSLSDFVYQTGVFCLTKASRITVLADPRVWFYDFYWVIALLALCPSWKTWRCCPEQAVLLPGLWLVAVITAQTSGSLHEANSQPLGPLAALAALWIYRDSTGRMRKAVFCGLLTGALVVSVGYGLELRAWPDAPHSMRPTYRLLNGPLKGWGCDRLRGETLEAVCEFVIRYVPSSEPLLILTDMQIVNPLTGRDSYRHIPWNWDVYGLPAAGSQLRSVSGRLRADSPIWILMNKSSDGYLAKLIPYLGLTEDLQLHYTVAMAWGDYWLLHRKF
ncbi:MAG: hypothetical protein WCG06_05470, partial [Candidatus Omnitrophota bacterium]